MNRTLQVKAFSTVLEIFKHFIHLSNNNSMSIKEAQQGKYRISKQHAKLNFKRQIKSSKRLEISTPSCKKKSLPLNDKKSPSLKSCNQKGLKTLAFLALTAKRQGEKPYKIADKYKPCTIRLIRPKFYNEKLRTLKISVWKSIRPNTSANLN